MKLKFEGKHECCSNIYYSTPLYICIRLQDATVDRTHDSGTRTGADELFSAVPTGPLWACKDMWKTGTAFLGAKGASLKVVDAARI